MGASATQHPPHARLLDAQTWQAMCAKPANVLSCSQETQLRSPVSGTDTALKNPRSNAHCWPSEQHTQTDAAVGRHEQAYLAPAAFPESSFASKAMAGRHPAESHTTANDAFTFDQPARVKEQLSVA